MFTPASLAFLRGLARHNNKPWFEAQRESYEHDVRDPMRVLIEEMDVRLARFAPEITGDPKRSMFRIHRDIRFSKDKSPYKTHAACWFRHNAADHRVGGDAEGAAPDCISISSRSNRSSGLGSGCRRGRRWTRSATRSPTIPKGSGGSSKVPPRAAGSGGASMTKRC